MAADPVLAAALLPFTVTEALGVAVALERSLKFGAEGPLAERYVLAMASTELGAAGWTELVGAMGSPAAHRPLLLESFARSSTVAIGYERDRRGASLRLYLEFWPPLLAALGQLSPAQQQRLQAGEGGEPWPLIVGVKWSVRNPEQAVLTRYGITPLLAAPLALAQFRQRLMLLFGEAPFLQALWPRVEAAQVQRPQQPVRLLHVLEDGEAGPNRRDSLDLDLADLDLPWAELAPTLQALTQHFPSSARGGAVDAQAGNGEVPLPAVGPEAQLTHLQAGLDRNGHPFFTLYHRG